MTENYHTHTVRCRHAAGTEEEYILSAIEAGIKVLGFSDHTPFLFPGDYYSTMRMFPDQLEDYVASVLALKEKYKDKIDIRLGLEVEYYPDRMADLFRLIAPYDIEYFILGQHWCGNEQNELYNGRATEDKVQLERYCSQCIEAMETGLFTYFAHPDLIYFTGDSAFYRQQMERLCRSALDCRMPLEINLAGYLTNRHYPREDFWEIAGKAGCQVVIGSDAHTPESIVMPTVEAKAMALVEKYDLQLLSSVPLRACK